MNNTPDPALLLSPCPPTGEQKQAMEQVLSRRYGRPVVLTWQEDRSISSGFLIKLGDETIDWTAQGRLEQLKQQLSALPTGAGSVIPLIREAVDQWQPQVQARQAGRVLAVADGIASVSGLPGASYGEVLLFENGVRGMVQNLSQDRDRLHPVR